MDQILVAGVDTLIGSNLRTTLGSDYSIVGAPAAPGSDGSHRTSQSAASFAAQHPDWIVYCGAASQSAWDQPLDHQLGIQEQNAVRSWATFAADQRIPFTYVSSDAVFSGPWMFHDESSESFCNSWQSERIRALEQEVRAICPHVWIVRTHAFGVGPDSAFSNWSERVIADLEQERVGDWDWRPHATPILASTLTRYLERGFRRKLSGLYHIAGAERVNPVQFVVRLAEELNLPIPQIAAGGTLSHRPHGFGTGESSLKTGRARRDLGINMPLLGDSLRQFAEQRRHQHHDLADSRAEKVA